MKNIYNRILKLVKLFFKRSPILLANLITLFFTVVIFTNSFEIIFEIDIPYAYSIKEFSSSNYLNNSNYHGINTNFQNKLTANYGNPKIVKFPSVNKRLELVNPIMKNNKFLVRTNKGHMMLDQNGNIIIYLLKSWQTLQGLDGISTGENVFLDSDKGWRYVYRIDEVGEANVDSKIVIPNSENPQLLIVIEDKENKTNAIIRCQYMTVINIQR